MKGIILNDYMLNIYFGFDETYFFWEKMLWKIIIIAIEACVGIDTSQKIK